MTEPASPPQQQRSQIPPEWIIAALILIYQNAELDLLRALASAVYRTIDLHDYQQRYSVTVGLEMQASSILRELHGQLVNEVPQVMTNAVNWGDNVALIDARRLLGAQAIPNSVIDRTLIDRTSRDLIEQLSSMNVVIKNVISNANQKIHEQAALEVLTQDLHLHHAKQRLLTQYAHQGITGFIDRRGRRWDLSTYAEMKIRTAATQAAIDSSLERFKSARIGLVHVSDSPRECSLCRPWEGKVLSIGGGGGGRHQLISPIDGKPFVVDVAGSMAEARLAGLFHPNCHHFILPYVPGTTVLPKQTADPKGDREQQQLRALERKLRAAKRVEAVALTADDKTAARATVRRWQAEIRVLARQTDQVRRVIREGP
jgi:hypothetical protein